MEKSKGKKKEEKKESHSHLLSSPQPLQQSQQPASKHDVFKKLSSLFFHPKTFIQEEQEKDYLPLLLIFVAITAITSIAQFIIALRILLSLGAKTVIVQGVSTLINIAFSFAIPFIVGGILHLGVLTFGGRKGFFSTFKPTTYALIIGALYSLFYLIAMNLYNLFVPLNQQFLVDLQNKIQSGTIALADLAPLKIRFGILILITLVSLIHTFYAVTLGVAKNQEMKKGKAFMAVILLPIIIMLLIIGAIAYIVVQGASSIPGVGG